MSTGGTGGGWAGGFVETPNVPFMPSRAWPGTEQRKRNVPLRGNVDGDRLTLAGAKRTRALLVHDDEVVDGAPAVSHDEPNGRARRHGPS